MYTPPKPVSNQPLNNNQSNPTKNALAGNNESNSANSPAPVRTMQSDAKRSDQVETQRQLAADRALAEIKALEKALSGNSSTSEIDLSIVEPALATEPKDVKLAPSTTSKPVVTTITAPQTAAATAKAENKSELDESLSKPISNNDITGPVIASKGSNITSSKGDKADQVAVLKSEISRLEKVKLDYIHKRNTFTNRELPIRNEISKLEVELENKESSLKPFIAQAKQIDTEILAFEDAERAAKTPNEKHAAEKKRWELEDSRHQLEEKKWQSSRQVEDTAKKIQVKNDELELVLTEASSTDKNIIQTENRIKELGLEIKLVELKQKKETLEVDWLQQNTTKRDLETELDQTKQSEATIETQVNNLYNDARSTVDSSVRHDYELERQKISLKRRDLEKKRWELEQKLQSIAQVVEELKPQYQQALDREESTRLELDALKTENSQ